MNEKGQLEIETGLEILKFTVPIAYQEKDGKKENIKIAYSVQDNEYSFKVGPYDKNRLLIIDPLLASTYLGGANHDHPWDISLDTSGNVYIAGYTKSADFPTGVGAYNPHPQYPVELYFPENISPMPQVFCALTL